MTQVATRPAPPDEFELYDNPSGGRIAGIGLALLGVAFVLLVWWEFPEGRTQQIWALFAAALGGCAVAGGVMLYLLSQRPPYLILRGDASGLRLVERFRFHREPVYVLLPWAQIKSFRLRTMGEAGYAVEVQDALPPEEEQRLRSKQKFASPPGILLFEVPLVWLPVREEWIMDTLLSISAHARDGRA